MDIVSAVAAGESNKSIARRLSLSEDTVKHHVSHVFDKLGVFSRLELAVFALNNDLVKDIAAFRDEPDGARHEGPIPQSTRIRRI
jgi:DNA-binding CsgD family transcriptional regulator